MSQIRKVELLNVPYRFYGLTVSQIIILAISGLIGFEAAMNVPNVKIINGLPLGFVVFMLIFCGAMLFVHANQIKPWQWWRNKILHYLRLRPDLYVPCYEPKRVYPDTTIIETKEKKQSVSFSIKGK